MEKKRQAGKVVDGRGPRRGGEKRALSEKWGDEIGVRGEGRTGRGC